MELIRVQNKELIAIAEEMASQRSPILPITLPRARSQVNNPFAEPDDVLLLYVNDDQDQTVGYAGMLPGQLNGRTDIKIFWNSCWYADPRYGGQVSIPLLKEFLKIAGNKVLFSDLSEKTVTVIDHLGDFVTGMREGLRLRMRSSLVQRAINLRSNNLRGKILKSMIVTAALKQVDWLLNVLMNRKIRFWTARQTGDIRIEEFETPNALQLEYIRKMAQNDVTVPCREQVEWWRNSHWLTARNAQNRWVGKHYYFSTFATDFRYVWLDIYREGTRLGIALLTFRDGVIKTPYLWFDRQHEDDFFRGLFRHIIRDARNLELITFQEGFTNYLSAHAPEFLHRRSLIRYTAIARELHDRDGSPFRMQDGDGDYLFT